MDLPEGLEVVDEIAMSGCKKLVISSWPTTLKEIGRKAFSSCLSSFIPNLTIPESVTSIGEDAFSSCYMETVDIKANIPSLNVSLFSDCTKLKKIKISSYTTEITLAFRNPFPQTLLEALEVDEDNPAYTAVDDVLMTKDQDQIIQYPYGKKLASYEIPSTVASLGDYSFVQIQIDSVTIPASVTDIGKSCFYYSTIKKVKVYWEEPLTVDETVFSHPETEMTLYVPYGTAEKYKAATAWKDYFTTIIESPKDNPTDISATEKGESIRISNVMDGQFTVNGAEGAMEVSIYNIAGDKIWNQTVMAGEPVSAGNMSQGIYIVSVRTEAGKVITQKIIK